MSACRMLLLLLWGIAGVSFGAEEILRFDSQVAIGSNGALTVTETIRVRAEGNNIRRGIFRDFPTDYRNARGEPVRVTFDVISTTRDGQREPHRTERLGNGVRLYLGSANVFLDPGEYTYEIIYESVGQLGFFEGFDELYWNATGNGWQFPIREATATVVLPEPVGSETLQLAAYTGPQGASGSNYRVDTQDDRSVRFVTTAPLGPYEGLTVAVGFPKGLVTAPAAAAPTAQRLLPVDSHARTLRAPEPAWKRWLRAVLAWGGTLGVFAYYLRAWQRVGRDPKSGSIIPRYEAPKGMSPAALRYVHRMKYDTTCLAAALVNLAVKGYLRIDQDRKFFFGREFAIEKLDTGTGPLAAGEKSVLSRLLGSRSRFEFDRKDHAIVQAALSAQERALEKEHRDRNFAYNRSYLIIGAVVSILLIILVAILGAIPPLIPLLIINGVFFFIMKAPTTEGRQLMDEIQGLKLYLGVAERDTFADMDRPRTLEEFERLLPYAVALDCASTWVDRFDDVLAELAQAGQLEDRPWVAGTGVNSVRNLSRSVDGLASGLSGAISSSSTAPGSSSGSSGGGFSGGGGGGGGGGGW